MPQHRAGGKITGSHTTVTDAAALVVDAAKKFAEVSKIGLGIIQGGIRSKQRRLKFKQTRAGWEVVVYGNTSLQTLYIYTSDPQRTKAALERIFA